MKILGFAGWSGSGKTTLLERLIPRLTGQGLKVSLIKHAHHEFDVDKPGKDSWRHRKAGCSEVLLVSDQRWALMHELRGEAEPSLEQCIAHVTPCDLLLVEGFKHDPFPKIETWRAEVGKPLLHPEDPHILAIASDVPVETRLPRFALEDDAGITAFIIRALELR